MVAVQIFSGQVPFSEAKSDAAVVAKVLRGTRPAKPEDAHRRGLTAVIWKWLENCWREDPISRPSMSLVKNGLKAAYDNHAHPAEVAFTPEYRSRTLLQVSGFGSESRALEKCSGRSNYGGTSSMGRNESASICNFE
jgi:hypothetical protein